MGEQNQKGWTINRQINVSVLVQLVCLATLIVGSWMNLQRQLDMLQRDVSMLVQANEKFQDKLETNSNKTIAFEYRIKSLENSMKESQDEKRDRYNN
ncbi:MAG: hypothetical protein KAS23_15215 [Anaerohalosphaera sp.]|nr:hypothetical protein [Anaerohalosphaera sp.]